MTHPRSKLLAGLAAAGISAGALLGACSGGPTGKYAATYPSNARALLQRQILTDASPRQLDCVLQWGANHQTWTHLYDGLWHVYMFGGTGGQAPWPGLNRACP